MLALGSVGHLGDTLRIVDHLRRESFWIVPIFQTPLVLPNG